MDAASKTDYFDSLYHASAVVGLNTSAMIEAGILGRPVHTVLLPEFNDSQEGTVHFHYLLDGPDALLWAARSLDQHADMLAASLEGRSADPDRSARFVRTFVRPGPIDTPATVRFVDALEQGATGRLCDVIEDVALRGAPGTRRRADRRESHHAIMQQGSGR